MNIQEAEKILRTEIALEKTPTGRSITKEAILNLDAVLSDQKNYGNQVVKCKGCGFITSILLIIDGCPNCNIVDIEADLKKE